MPLKITGRHHEVTQRQREYIEKKVERVRRHFDRIQTMHFILSEEKVSKSCEITFHAGAIHAVVTASDDQDMLAAIDKAVDKLEAKTDKEREKLHEHVKHGGREKNDVAAAAAEAEAAAE